MEQFGRADHPWLPTGIQSIKRSPTGEIWFATVGGAARARPTGAGKFKFEDVAAGAVSTIDFRGDGGAFLGTSVGMLRYPLSGGPVPGIRDVHATYKRDDDLLVGTNGGLVKIRPDGSVVEVDPSTKEQVSAIAEDSTNALWIAKPDGPAMMESGGWQTKWRDDVKAMRRTKRGDLWFASAGGGIHVLSGQKWTVPIPSDPSLGDVVTKAILVEEKSGAVWFGTYQGARRLEKSGKWSSWVAAPSSLVANDVLSIAESGGAVWFRSGKGISRFDTAQESWTRYLDGIETFALCSDGAEGVWVGTASGLQHIGRASGEFAAELPIEKGAVTALARGPNAVWIATRESIRRLDDDSTKSVPLGVRPPEREAIQTLFASHDRLLLGTYTGLFAVDLSPPAKIAPIPLKVNDIKPTEASVLSIRESPDGRAWIATARGFYRLEQNQHVAVLVFPIPEQQVVHALAQEANGALWLGTDHGALRIVRQGPEAGSVVTVPARPPPQLAAAAAGEIVIVRNNRVYHVTSPRDGQPESASQVADALPPRPAGATPTVIALAPSKVVWVGTLFGGLRLRTPGGTDRVLASGTSLPSPTITALAAVAAVPSGERTNVSAPRAWVGTTGGLALVQAKGDSLEPVPVSLAGLPPGRVDAVAGGDDGTAWAVYNVVNQEGFDDPEVAKRRQVTQVWHVATGRAPERVAVSDDARQAFEGSRIHGAVFGAAGKRRLWVATSNGLFVAEEPAFTLSLAAPSPGELTFVQALVVADDDWGSLWLVPGPTQEHQPRRLVEYRHGDGTKNMLNLRDGAGASVAVSDGVVWVFDGSSLFHGRVYKPVTPYPTTWQLIVPFAVLVIGVALLVRKRAKEVLQLAYVDATTLGSVRSAASAVAQLRWTWGLSRAWREFGFPEDRAAFIARLAPESPGADGVHALTELLGAESTEAGSNLGNGLYFTRAVLPEPGALRKRPVPFFTFEPTTQGGVEPLELKRAITEALERLHHPIDIPTVMLISDHEIGRAISPDSYGMLLVGQSELLSLLFASSPPAVFAGLLHKKGLLLVSPYTTHGHAPAEMFFGRADLLRELVGARARTYVVAGPRRVGKTSLLRRVEQQMKPSHDVIFLDLLGMRDHAAIARQFASRYGEVLPSTRSEVLLADLLVERRKRRNEPMALIIDEADGILQKDAAHPDGYPFFNSLRRLQADGTCSCLLAGYQELYRATLDQRSPLYNFGEVRLLGPLDESAAQDLATLPMTRIGVRYSSDDLVKRIVERSGGYPSMTQMLCGAALDQLKGESGAALVLTEGHLRRAEQSPQVAGDLLAVFRMNTPPLHRLIALLMLDWQVFKLDQVQTALEKNGVRRTYDDVDDALAQLVLFGFFRRHGRGGYGWAVPLLRDVVRESESRAQIASLLSEARTPKAGVGR
jgi:ligand-binding sensor domain-containing protein